MDDSIDPILAIILPQLGSSPNMAVLTSIELDNFFETSWARIKLFAFVTFSLMNFVAPSPSLTIRDDNLIKKSDAHDIN